MKISGTHTFPAPRSEVWPALQNPDVLTSILPGCEKLDQTGDNQYQGILNIKVGPVQGKFKGDIELTDIDPPNGYTMKVDGRGAPGFVRATAKVALTDAEGGGTEIAYDADAQVGGRIASVGQRLLDSSAKSIIGQSLEAFDDLFQARQSATAAGKSEEEAQQEAVAAARRSESEIASRVAKDVAGELVPPGARVAIAVAVVVVLLIILYFAMR